MLFNVFHRTLELDEFFSSSSIIASFLALSTRRTTVFLAILKDSLRTSPLCNPFFNSSRSFTTLKIHPKAMMASSTILPEEISQGHVDQL